MQVVQLNKNPMINKKIIQKKDMIGIQCPGSDKKSHTVLGYSYISNNVTRWYGIN